MTSPRRVAATVCPVPAADFVAREGVAPVLEIEPVFVGFARFWDRRPWEAVKENETFVSSFRLFTVLFAVPVVPVSILTDRGRHLSPASLDALNAFLMHNQGGPLLHWRRIGAPAPLSRFGWSAFKDQLGFRFI